jgi:hypothetical protein
VGEWRGGKWRVGADGVRSGEKEERRERVGVGSVRREPCGFLCGE